MDKRAGRANFERSDDLPDDLGECHALIRQLFDRVSELEKQLSRRNRNTFGKKSAKVDATLLTGTGKAIHDQTSDELDAEMDRLNIVAKNEHGGGRSKLPPQIRTRTVEHRAQINEIACPCCGNNRQIIGFDVSHQLEFVKTLFETIQHVVFKYGCSTCNGEIFTTQKPYQPIDKGLAGPGLLAKIATDKFWLHLPLYRQEQVFLAQSLPINRASMCRWLKGVAEVVAPIVQRMRELIVQSRVVQSDATTLPVIKKGLGKTHRGIVWVYRGDVDHPYVFYDYSNTEHAQYPEKILAGFKGILQTDGTNKYNEIIRAGATSAACFAHVHCYFEDAWKSDPGPAEFPMGVIKSLFEIERLAVKLTPDERYDLRQRLAKPKLEKLKAWLDEKKEGLLLKGKLEDAVSYTLNRWPALLTYLDHPFVEISNNGSEHSVKTLVMSRKNWLFAGSEVGAQTAVTITSLVETCKRLEINPFVYLKDVLARFPSAKTSQIDDFLPDRRLTLRQNERPPQN